MPRYMFLEWRDELNNLVGTTPSINLLIDKDKTLTAYYQEVPVTEYTLTIATTAGGSTSPTPGSYAYAQGSTATVTAIPNSGYLFDHWILDGTTRTENPIIVLMNGNHVLTAYFRTLPPTQYTLTLSTTTGGTTNPSPGTYPYNQGTTVTVTATASSGYRFNHWTLDGANTGSTNPISVLMNANHTLQAVFTLIPTYTLTIQSGAGGNTNPSPGIYPYYEGATVQVTASPSSGYYFNHWVLDGTEYTTNPISVLMNASRTLTAYFSVIPPPPPETYKVNVNTTIGGSTNPTPGIYEHESGTTITVTATPQPEMFFDHWELDGAIRTENPITITMDKDHTLLAVFASTPPPPPMPIGWMLIPVILGGIFVGYLWSRKK